MMYKLLATDLDDTLLNDNGEIPENTRLALQRAKQAGVRVCLCSGRSYLSLRRYEEALGLRGAGCYGIGFNGSMVYQAWDRKVLRDVRLANGLAMTLTDAIAPFGGDLMVYDGDTLYARRMTESLRYYATRSGIGVALISSFHDIGKDVSKVLIKADYDTLLDVQTRVRPLIAGKCNMFLTAKHMLEFTALGADKGAALAFLAAHLGIDMAHVIAVGDNFNDIHMIQAAGLGIAVANAEADVKAAADHVTRRDHNAGALAEVVEEFLLT